MKCQACGCNGIDMFDVCPKCYWENDDSLDSAAGVVHVSFELTDAQKGMWSYANGSSPNAYSKMIYSS
ncbi:hypothetical protein UFOVP1290_187 [uncultured Caudovirales phage]|uniref:Cysteine-rich CPCC domain-containing protein n=1 Tax=uncultured Caudovirales phage TaxID=2100421 RepID=A0A6J5RQW2_9CAUD|nr:hypothetical protein UFOVP1290_187 [uncultured Caudovirales phage]